MNNYKYKVGDVVVVTGGGDAGIGLIGEIVKIRRSEMRYTVSFKDHYDKYTWSGDVGDGRRCYRWLRESEIAAAPVDFLAGNKNVYVQKDNRVFLGGT